MSGRIVVLGMHRSGTSCVGELLAAMGAYLGPRGMGTTGTVDNPPGPFRERWVHTHGCRRWFELTRDTVTHEIHVRRE